MGNLDDQSSGNMFLRGTVVDQNKPNDPNQFQPEKPYIKRLKRIIFFSGLVLAALGMPAYWFYHYYWQLPEHFRLAEISYPSDPGKDAAVTAECWFQVESDRDIACGFLFTRLKSGDPGSTRLMLPYAVFKSGRVSGNKAPVFYIAGGPGAAELVPGIVEYWPDWISKQKWLAGRDLVILDQRGTGYAQPQMDCTEFRRLFMVGLHRDNIEDIKNSRAAREDCDRKMERRLSDASLMSASESAEDVILLHKKLGYTEWVLLGVSAGGVVAQEVLRKNPTGLNSVILDSPVPAGWGQGAFDMQIFDRGLGQLSEICQRHLSETRCGKASLKRKLETLYSQLAKKPQKITIDSPFHGLPQEYLVDEYVFLTVVFDRLSRSNDGGIFAKELLSSSLSKPDSLGWVAQSFINSNFDLSFSLPTHKVYHCNDNNSGFADSEKEDGKIYRTIGFREAYLKYANETNVGNSSCKKQGVDRRNRQTILPVESDRPVLLLSGELDQITPTERIAEIVPGLSQGQLMRIPMSGHGMLFGEDRSCLMRLVQTFLDNPTEELRFGCSVRRQS